MSLDDIIENFNIAKSKKFLRPTINSFINKGIPKEKIFSFVEKYEKIVSDAIREATSYKSKYDKLMADPVIKAYLDQKERFDKIEDRMDRIDRTIFGEGHSGGTHGRE